MINMNVTNKDVHINSLRIMGVGGSSVVLIGDTEVVTCSSIFDTPPESLIIGPIRPLAAESGGR